MAQIWISKFEISAQYFWHLRKLFLKKDVRDYSNIGGQVLFQHCLSAYLRQFIIAKFEHFGPKSHCHNAAFNVNHLICRTVAKTCAWWLIRTSAWYVFVVVSGRYLLLDITITPLLSPVRSMTLKVCTLLWIHFFLQISINFFIDTFYTHGPDVTKLDSCELWISKNSPTSLFTSLGESQNRNNRKWKYLYEILIWDKSEEEIIHIGVFADPLTIE